MATSVYGILAFLDKILNDINPDIAISYEDKPRRVELHLDDSFASLISILGTKNLKSTYLNRNYFDKETILWGVDYDYTKVFESQALAVSEGKVTGPILFDGEPVLKLGSESILSSYLQIKKYFNDSWLLNAGIRYDAKNRLTLLQKLFKNNDKIEVNDFEILKNRAVYSIETVQYLQQLYKPSHIYMIIGSDNLEKLHLWKNYDELKTTAEFVAVTRSGFLNENYGSIKTLKVDINISSTKLRDNLDLDFIPKKIQNDVKLFWQKTQKVRKL